MDLVRIEGQATKEQPEWVHWITRTQREILEGREATIAEEAYQQGLSDAEDK